LPEPEGEFAMKVECSSPMRPARAVAQAAHAHQIGAGGRPGGMLPLLNRRAGMC